MKFTRKDVEQIDMKQEERRDSVSDVNVFNNMVKGRGQREIVSVRSLDAMQLQCII